ncbi:28S ribosomal protein S18b, mitochondrial [Eurytemora carolleeae]|uniref:28S ribosomal protein S18b, mitochondrial n=1 Tax=Eurytemora carolleeae TaxID=1294199 RepID=UPI000C77BCD3|nr:28S ribosomal protein S18b, mitochondrial [Eurytemora carolleeae]XP_023324892.1 28S ribosomal protein S18b, mitochondrial [Eurytemora carolleeae]|eukprot:XP_023324891.1 28S ribosomal protein S18b, mitochondrial-like [Eurytemora affinis]
MSFRNILPLIRKPSRNFPISHFLQNQLIKTNINHLKLRLPVSKNTFCTSRSLLAADDEAEEEIKEEEEQDEDGSVHGDNVGDFVEKYYDQKDRSRNIPVELSMKYLESVAYRATYGDEPVWTHYRRNMKGGNLFIPKTRESCIRDKKIANASPCPICRDEYLVVDYRNIGLLQQFIDPYSGALIDPYKTGVCQFQWRRLQIHIEKALEHGLLSVDAPLLYYDEEIYRK